MIVTVKLLNKNIHFVPAALILICAIVWSPLAFLGLSFIASQVYARVFRTINLVNGLFLGIFSTIAYTTILAFLIDFINPNIGQFTIIHILLVLTIGVYFIVVRGQLVRYDSSTIKYSALSILLALVASLFMLIPAYNNRSSEGLVYFLSSGEDNASHFAMINYNMTHNSPSYFNKDTGLIPSLNIYPQGIHSSSAFVYEAVFGDKAQSTRIHLVYYYLVTVAVSAALIFIVSEFIGLITWSRYKYLIMILSSFTIFISSVLFLAGWGFMTQIVALVYIVAFAFVLTMAEKSGKKIKPDNTGLLELTIYGSLLLGLIFSWYLLVIVFGALLLTRVHPLIIKGNVKTYSLFVLFGFLALAPIALNIFAGKGSGAINEPGGVYIYESLGASTMVMGLGIFFLILIKFGFKNKLIPITFIALFISTFLTTLLIGSYQLFTTGELLYYFYKSLYLSLIAAILLIFIFLSFNLQGIKKKWQVITTHIFILSLVIFGYILINPTYPQVYVNNWFRHVITPSGVTDIITTKENQPETQDVLYDMDCSYIEEYILNRWSGALFLSEQDERSELTRNAFPKQQSIKISDSYLKKHPHTKIITRSCS